MEDYLPGTQIWHGAVPDIYCTLYVNKLDPPLSPAGHVRLLINIEHDYVLEHLSYQPSMDLVYTEEDYATLMREDSLIENIKIHYLYAESLQRDLDEYFH